MAASILAAAALAWASVQADTARGAPPITLGTSADGEVTTSITPPATMPVQPSTPTLTSTPSTPAPTPTTITDAAPTAAATPSGTATESSTGEWPPPGIATGSTHHYVSATATDGGSGSPQAPFSTLQQAADAAAPDTVIHVAPGAYEPVPTAAAGTQDARVMWLSDVRWAAKITSPDRRYGFTNEGSYVDIVGFEITAPQSTEGIESVGRTAVRVLHNKVHSVATDVDCDTNGGAGIEFADYASDHNEANANLVYDIGPDTGCPYIHGIYLSQPDGVMSNNIVHDVEAWCLHLWHGATDMTVTNNLAFHCGRGGEGGGITAGAGDNPPDARLSDSLIANNIVIDSAAGIQETGRIGSGNRFANNIVHHSGPAVTVSSETSGLIEQDPRLIDYRRDGSGDYRPAPGSPAIGAGIRAGAPATDFNGAPRGPSIDIGPYTATSPAAQPTTEPTTAPPTAPPAPQCVMTAQQSPHRERR